MMMISPASDAQILVKIFFACRFFMFASSLSGR